MKDISSKFRSAILQSYDHLERSDEAVTVSWRSTERYKKYFQMIKAGFNFEKEETDSFKSDGKTYYLKKLGPSTFPDISGKYVYLLLIDSRNKTGKITHFLVSSNGNNKLKSVNGDSVVLTDGSEMVIIPKTYTSIRHIMALILGVGKYHLKATALEEAVDEIETNPILQIRNKWEIINAMLDMVFVGSSYGCIIGGNPGMGKTYTIMQKLKELGLEEGVDYLYFQGGKFTLTSFYSIIHDNPTATLIFDDSDSVFDSADGINMLKAALDSNEPRVVTYDSPAITSKGMETSVVFEGKMVFLTNLPLERINNAIIDRSVTQGVWLTREQVLADLRDKYLYVKSLAEVKGDKDAITEDEKTKIFEHLDAYVRKFMKKGIERPKSLSMRLLKKCYDIYGDLKKAHLRKKELGQNLTDEDLWNQYKKVAESQFEIS